MPRIIVSLRGHTLSLSLSLSLSHSPIQTPNPSSSGSLFSYPSRPLVRSQRSLYRLHQTAGALITTSSSSNHWSCRWCLGLSSPTRKTSLSLCFPKSNIGTNCGASVVIILICEFEYVSMLIPCLKIWILIVRKRCFTVQDWFDVCYKGYNL
ncbi:uncharacterized protein LOC114312862 isoform X2 [Camellia sinensis]|uniref:uncharacterized protein LOC114312862 isoform X2 n=1 Tax=Camellia sinensis TaxID=4442 RepID=UPI001035A153|nr:uncharacterized protein LOC114312862 isoform X2 [Camellia sinensis]